MSGASTPETPRFPGDPRPIEIAPGATRRVDLNSYFEGATECAFTLWSSLDPEVATAKVVGDTLIVEGRAEGETGLIVRASGSTDPGNLAQGLIPVVVSFAFAPTSAERSEAGGWERHHPWIARGWPSSEGGPVPPPGSAAAVRSRHASWRTDASAVAERSGYNGGRILIVAARHSGTVSQW